MNRQSIPKGQPFSPPIDHKIDMLALSILFVGFFSCLVRSDYNFAIIFFCYFVWQQRKDLLSLRLIMVSIVVLFAFDFIFIFTEMRLWNQTDANNLIWQAIQPLHGFAIFCFIVINLLKIALLIFVGKGISQLNKPVQTM